MDKFLLPGLERQQYISNDDTKIWIIKFMEESESSYYSHFVVLSLGDKDKNFRKAFRWRTITIIVYDSSACICIDM